MKFRNVSARSNEKKTFRYFTRAKSARSARRSESTASGCDVRFNYVHPRDSYLSIDVEEKRDVADRPFSGLGQRQKA